MRFSLLSFLLLLTTWVGAQTSEAASPAPTPSAFKIGIEGGYGVNRSVIDVAGSNTEADFGIEAEFGVALRLTILPWLHIRSGAGLALLSSKQRTTRSSQISVGSGDFSVQATRFTANVPLMLQITPSSSSGFYVRGGIRRHFNISSDLTVSDSDTENEVNALEADFSRAINFGEGSLGYRYVNPDGVDIMFIELSYAWSLDDFVSRPSSDSVFDDAINYTETAGYRVVRLSTGFWF